jgi:hypothetical protein
MDEAFDGLGGRLQRIVLDGVPELTGHLVPTPSGTPRPRRRRRRHPVEQKLAEHQSRRWDPVDPRGSRATVWERRKARTSSSLGPLPRIVVDSVWGGRSLRRSHPHGAQQWPQSDEESPRVQPGAGRYGCNGIGGNIGNLESVTYRI